LDKQLAPIHVQGDGISLPPERFAEFFRSLVHVFRNAVDHGIETPEERLEIGKPVVGTISCTLTPKEDVLEIVIADDGRGIDRSALEAKLRRAGVSATKIAELSLEDLVFCEGLSSRETASEVSGRGIGLAAVKAELDRLGGSVVIDSSTGKGARFLFRLPIGKDGFDDLTTQMETACL
jgi:chemotaxis protein histidine kinase CheA